MTTLEDLDNIKIVSNLECDLRKVDVLLTDEQHRDLCLYSRGAIHWLTPKKEGNKILVARYGIFYIYRNQPIEG